jgi:50S ribosomal subunit-associated GTPase HflX
MGAFDPQLPQRPRLIALNKLDLLPEEFPLEQVVEAYAQTGWRVLPVSAQTGAGLTPLKQAIWHEFAPDRHESLTAAASE